MEDVARAAGVGVATVDRVINRRAPVRADTAQRVLDAAQTLGFRRAGLISKRISEQQRPLRLGFLLQSQRSPFYTALGHALEQAVQALQQQRATPVLAFMDDFTPRKVAERLLALGQQVDAVALVAADHPVIHQAIETLHAQGVPVFALVTDLSAPSVAGYVGMDNRKMGRTAAWSIAKLSQRPGKVGLILGSHRYLCQEQCEISFRSYLRESAPGFQVLETLVSLEDVALAHAATLELLHLHPDLVGVYVAGGGVEGVLEALQEAAMPELVTVCHDLTDTTRQALLDGHASVVLSHPCEWMARSLCEAMQKRLQNRQPVGKSQGLLPFTLYTVANV
ncbi:LacI family transcriptional regulator [Rhodoferax lacus]|uniref:LacI family transcriptional regulator n=2 Tax=Rhodoferax lacus TaxID=2184758 RepID=A0A3E1R7C9_9BURK|nr:LacI family transcriptional regulator [Rhodoferax lacus]